MSNTLDTLISELVNGPSRDENTLSVALYNENLSKSASAMTQLLSIKNSSPTELYQNLLPSPPISGGTTDDHQMNSHQKVPHTPVSLPFFSPPPSHSSSYMDNYYSDAFSVMSSSLPSDTSFLGSTDFARRASDTNLLSLQNRMSDPYMRRSSMPFQQQQSMANSLGNMTISEDEPFQIPSHHQRSMSMSTLPTAPLGFGRGRRASVATSTVYQCQEPGCFRTFNRLQNLKSHARCHLKVSPHVCTTCQHSFRRSTDLARHIRTVHAPEEQKPWGCNDCGKRFGRSDALKRHQASKSKLYGCPARFAAEEEVAQRAAEAFGHHYSTF